MDADSRLQDAPLILNASAHSCDLNEQRFWTQDCWCNLDCNTGSLSLFRIHFEKLKNIPVLQLDASMEFQSDPVVQEQFITKVCLTVAGPRAAMPGTTTGGPCPGVWVLISESHVLIHNLMCLFVILPGEELLQFLVRRAAVGTDEISQMSVAELLKKIL